jgi:hypothetical protein
MNKRDIKKELMKIKTANTKKGDRWGKKELLIASKMIHKQEPKENWTPSKHEAEPLSKLLKDWVKGG